MKRQAEALALQELIKMLMPNMKESIGSISKESKIPMMEEEEDEEEMQDSCCMSPESFEYEDDEEEDKEMPEESPKSVKISLTSLGVMPKKKMIPEMEDERRVMKKKGK